MPGNLAKHSSVMLRSRTSTLSKAIQSVSLGAICVLWGVSSSSCSSAPKKTTPELSHLLGKKIALMEVLGESTARSVVEVALINQVQQKGTFILISKQDLARAREEADLEATDWKGIARRAGADVALRVRVLKFIAESHEGYSSETVEDSELEAEQGKSAAKSERLFKVKSLDAEVAVKLEFTDLKSDEVRSAVAQAQDQAKGDARQGGIQLPPRLRFLEKLSNRAFEKFFDTYR